jgi:glycine betaine/proline transport system ATP-binding protein
VVQVGTPEEILKNPADDYVRAFFRGVDPTNILSAGDIARDVQITLVRHRGEGPRAALERLARHDRPYAYVLDAERRFQGVVSVESLKEAINKKEEARVVDAFLPDVEPVQADKPLQELIPILTGNPWPLPVVDDQGKYVGAISKNVFLETLYRAEAEEVETQEEAHARVDAETEAEKSEQNG